MLTAANVAPMATVPRISRVSTNRRPRSLSADGSSAQDLPDS
jgi:hypothetical protein